METELISVIIPVYNTGDLLTRCVESVLKQTYTAIEIIIVDDGSTDGITPKICDCLSEKYRNVFCIHKKNGGQGTARNVGLEIANGKYIAFVDSDDWIDPEMYSILYKNMIDFEADISCCNNGIFTENDTRVVKVFTQPDVMLEHLYGNKGTGHSPCDKLYKAELFESVRFLSIRAYEDCGTIFKVFSIANKVVYDDITLYHYEKRENSTMTQSFSSIKYLAITAYYEMYQFYLSKFPEYVSIVKESLIGSIQYCIGEALLLDSKGKYCKEIEFAKDILKKIGIKGIAFKYKLSIIMMLYFEKIYVLAYFIRHRLKHK